MRICAAVALVSIGCWTHLVNAADDAFDAELFEPASLTIGSEAPRLEIEHWFLDEESDREPVTEFQPGCVYVVEFWGTFCAPCIANMPHLAQLQDKYGDQVAIIGVTDESRAKVDAFFAKAVGGDGERKYVDLARRYRFAADPDRSTHRDYKDAFRAATLPFAVIVGKDGEVEWVGNRLDQLEDALAAVVGDRWDRDAFAKVHARDAIGEEIRYLFNRLIRNGDPSEANTKRAIQFYKQRLANPIMTDKARARGWDEVEIEIYGYLFSLMASLPEYGPELEQVIDQALAASSKDTRSTVIYATELVQLKVNNGRLPRGKYRERVVPMELTEKALEASERLLHGDGDTDISDTDKFLLEFQLAGQYGELGRYEHMMTLLEGLVARQDANAELAAENLPADFLREQVLELRESLNRGRPRTLGEQLRRAREAARR